MALDARPAAGPRGKENEQGEVVKEVIPLSMTEIIDNLHGLTGGWPRGVDATLFVHDPVYGICWIQKTAELFGWISRCIPISWKQGSSFVKQPELFAELRRTAKKYLSVEELPHEPPLDGHFYTCGEQPIGDGSTLARLIHRFSPATSLDGQLLVLAFVTPGWGGPAGCRPCFVITSDDGRGAGKSTVVAMIGQLWGGILQFSQNEDAADIKKRLLSPAALLRRIASMDNVKSLRFSKGDLEGMITAPEIGGHRLYEGEATRPNTLTWYVTLNGANLSTDLAQRSVIIKIRKPERSGTWEEETRAFIEDHRNELLADVVTALRDEQHYLERYSRWASWEREVLQRAENCNELQALILERQAAVDAEEEESGILEDHFRGELSDLHYDPAVDQVFIPSKIAAEWYNHAHNDRAKTQAVSRMLKQAITEGRLSRLRVNNCRAWGRGFIWIGEGSDPNDSISTDIESRLQHVKVGVLP